MFLEHFPEDGKYNGWIEVICGSMFSGKTEELIRRLRRVEFAGLSFLLFKPTIDKRYSRKEIVTHNGDSFEAIEIEKAVDVFVHWKDECIVAFDETQFFDEGIVEVVNQLAAKGVRVICAGLDMDFQGKPFGLIPALMASAEYVTKVHAVCVSCGNLANFSYRISDEKKQVFLGAVDEYKPLCRACYNKVKH